MEFHDIEIKYVELEIVIPELRVNMPWDRHYPTRKYTIKQVHKFENTISLNNFKMRYLKIGELKTPENVPNDFCVIPKVEDIIGIDEGKSFFDVFFISSSIFLCCVITFIIEERNGNFN